MGETGEGCWGGAGDVGSEVVGGAKLARDAGAGLGVRGSVVPPPARRERRGGNTLGRGWTGPGGPVRRMKAECGRAHTARKLNHRLVGGFRKCILYAKILMSSQCIN